MITGGNNLNHLFDYAEASTTDPSTNPGTKAYIDFAQPEPSTPTGAFPLGQASGAVAFPNSSAPYTGANPLATLQSSDGDLAAFIGSQTPPTAAGYVNVYQIRLYTTSPSGGGTKPSGTYWEIDVSVDPTAGTWTETYPNQGSTGLTTTTTVSASPVPGVQGSPVTLTATTTASDSSQPGGTVQFFQDGIAVGSPATVDSTGTATLTTSALLPSAPNGTKITGTFTPSNASYSPSTSAPFTYTVDPTATVPTLSGAHTAGKPETCNEGTLDFGVTASYTWLVGTTQVGTGATFTVPGTAYKKALTCKVSVSDGGGPASTATSASVTVSRGGALTPLKHKGPSLSGPRKVGKTEKVNPGDWNDPGASHVTFTYQWMVNGKFIKGATKSSLKLSRSDKGKKLSCRVTAHAAGFANGSVTTSSVKVLS